jgi:hypothetical protein
MGKLHLINIFFLLFSMLNLPSFGKFLEEFFILFFVLPYFLGLRKWPGLVYFRLTKILILSFIVRSIFFFIVT